MRLAFKKVTPEGLSVDVEQYQDLRVLLLTKDTPGRPGRAAQLVGIVDREVDTPTVTWYYEYQPMPRAILNPVTHWLEARGYVIGVFDQFGNFSEKVA